MVFRLLDQAMALSVRYKQLAGQFHGFRFAPVNAGGALAMACWNSGARRVGGNSCRLIRQPAA